MDVDGNEDGDAASDSLLDEDENDDDSSSDQEDHEEEEDDDNDNDNEDEEGEDAGGDDDDDDDENVGDDNRRDDGDGDGFWSKISTEQDMMEMKRSLRRPSEWLKLLCKEWVYHGSAGNGDDSKHEGTRQRSNNIQLADATDRKLMEYKPYLKDGKISPQLLCTLCQKQQRQEQSSSLSSHFDFWNILNITDEFDKAYIVSQVERFESMYNILNLTGRIRDDKKITNNTDTHHQPADPPSTMETTALRQRKRQSMSSSHPFEGDDDDDGNEYASTKNDNSVSFQKDSKRLRGRTKTRKNETRRGRDAVPLKKQLRTRVQQEQEKQRLTKQEENRIRKEIELENLGVQQDIQKRLKAQQREQKKQLKVIEQRQRELSQQEQKQAALQRAAELVKSNRVPIELTGVVKKASSSTGMTSRLQDSQQQRRKQRPRSRIMVSTASDLQQIVTHANNLHVKYKAIADAHGTTVSWSTIANEIGIGVKVREKYFRMYNRAVQRNFDFSLHGHWKLRDHPEIFIEPCHLNEQTTSTNNNSRKTAEEIQPQPPPAAAAAPLKTETISTTATSQDSTLTTAMMMLTSASPNLTSLTHPELRIDSAAALDDPLSAPSSPSRVPFHDDGDFFPPSAVFANQEDISDAREASVGAAASTTFPPSLPPSPVVEKTGEDGDDDDDDDDDRR